jgi:hypothetical protein
MSSYIACATERAIVLPLSVFFFGGVPICPRLMLTYSCRRDSDLSTFMTAFLWWCYCQLNIHLVVNVPLRERFHRLYETFSLEVLLYTFVPWYHVGAAERAICPPPHFFSLGDVIAYSRVIASCLCRGESAFAYFISLVLWCCYHVLSNHLISPVPLRERLAFLYRAISLEVLLYAFVLSGRVRAAERIVSFSLPSTLL